MVQGSSVSSPTRETILQALRRVEDPELHRDVVSLNMIQNLEITGGDVSLTLVLTTPACPVRHDFQESVAEAIRAVPGVTSATVQLSANVRANDPRANGPKAVEGVRNVIAVASNKGGVGKSTVAANLAVALAQSGARVGLLDADITGPNIPTMMGFTAGFMAAGGQAQGLHTETHFGVKVASLGFLLPKGTPVVWRGPMIGSAVRQLLHDLSWGELDYLIIDLPPGTSDASMSMCQEAAIAGAIIVSTPQQVALEDAIKAVGMFEKLNVPIFGIVENMSYFVCPHCGERTDIFGHGGVEGVADELGLDVLGEIPLHPSIREGADAGVPITVSAPDSPQARAFVRLAERVAAKLSVLQWGAA